ncbi:RHS repeat-associated core domain-containing protein [Roseateles chitinivorans]|uniref:RHS repeat-associated core domain-containing protein n=1 Tax=Roseateles chitinivorans TaxID=2917965 RepID=UPI003D6795AB
MTYSGGEVSSRTDAAGNRTTVFSDTVGRLRSFSDALGNASHLSYDAMDRLTSMVDAKGGTLGISYDGNGNVLSQTDEKFNARTFGYDKRNRQTFKKDPLLQQESSEREPGGRPRKITDRKGQQMSVVSMDALGRPIQVGFGATVDAPNVFKSTVTYTWDAGDRLVKAIDSSSGEISWSFDGLDRPLSETTSQGSVGYAYDAGGRRTAMTLQGLPTTRYVWDKGDRLVRITQDAHPVNGQVAQTVSFAFDQSGRRNQVTLANGIVGSYVRGADDRIERIAYTGSNGVVLGEAAYTYDAAGRMTAATGSLAGSVSDAVLSDTVIDANGRLTQWNGHPATYDANGNLLNDGTNTYTWDERNRLIRVDGARTTTYGYDALDRRVSRTVDGITTQVVHDGWNVASTSGSGLVVLRLNGLETDESYAVYRNGNQSHLLVDSLGSMRAVATADQQIVSTLSYSAYGNVSVVGSQVPDWQYTGRENDGNGLYYYRHRYYNPTIGRFISEDPIGWASGQSSAYAYVGGNPLSYVDPTGLSVASMVSDLTGGCSSNSFVEDVVNNFVDVEERTSLLQIGTSLALGGQFAKTFGGMTILGAAGGLYGELRSGFTMTGIGSRTFLQAAVTTTVTTAVNTVLIKGAFDAGILVGSILRTAVNRAASSAACTCQE